MNCSDARHLIHLDVGDDLRSEEESLLAGHMEQCGECRSYHAGMSSAMNALMVLRDVPSEQTASAPVRSVWPAVSREIQKRRTTPAKARKFNLQVAMLSVCSLSLAVVTIVQSLSSMRNSMEITEFAPSQFLTPENGAEVASPPPRTTNVTHPGPHQQLVPLNSEMFTEHQSF